MSDDAKYVKAECISRSGDTVRAAVTLEDGTDLIVEMERDELAWLVADDSARQSPPPDVLEGLYKGLVQVIACAEEAMICANNDGAGFPIDAELARPRAALTRYDAWEKGKKDD